MLTQNDTHVARPQEMAEQSQQETTPFRWSVAWKEAGWIFLFSRLVLLITTFIGTSRFYHLETNPVTLKGVELPPQQCITDLQHCLHAWDWWDVGLFIDVAHRGYFPKHELAAIFPLWPLLLHIFGDFFPNPYTAMFFVGLLLVNIIFYSALVLLYRLVCTHFEPGVARDTLFFVALGPYALFYFIGYSEGIFLLLTLGLCFFLQRGRALDWWLAGLCGFLAVLSRGAGLILAVPFLVVLVQRFWPYRNALLSQWRAVLNATLPLVLIPFAVVCYMLYLRSAIGDPLAFSTGEALSWGRYLVFPWVGIVNALQALFVGTANDFAASLADLLFTLLPIGVLIASWRRLPWHYSLFSLVMVLYSLCYPIRGSAYPLGAMPRFMMVIFPIFMLLAYWGSKRPRLRSVMMGLSLTFFIINALLFLTHNWVA